jgi:hypothetical protein
MIVAEQSRSLRRFESDRLDRPNRHDRRRRGLFAQQIVLAQLWSSLFSAPLIAAKSR